MPGLFFLNHIRRLHYVVTLAPLLLQSRAAMSPRVRPGIRASCRDDDQAGKAAVAGIGEIEPDKGLGEPVRWVYKEGGV